MIELKHLLSHYQFTKEIYMRILILANSDVGLYKFRKELIEALLSLKHEVYISLPQGEFIDRLVEIGCHFIKTTLSRHGVNQVKDFSFI